MMTALKKCRAATVCAPRARIYYLFEFMTAYC